MSEERPSKLRVVSYVLSGVGVVTWIVYLVLRYGQQRDVPPLLWSALLLVIVGFAIRRSQQST
ncbi:MAG: hypothetical protein WKG00_29995 [Polyangiaceae bacterium]